MKQKLLFSLLTSLLLLSACSSPTESDDNSGESSVGDNTSSEEQNGSSEENKSSFENGNSEEQNNSSSENEGTSSEEGSSSESGSFTSEPNDQDCAYDAGAHTLACDEKTYKTVVIGDQVWMAENLNYGAYVEGRNSSSQLLSGSQKFCYDNLVSNCEDLGGLYQWHIAMALPVNCGDGSTSCVSSLASPIHQGICPNGWHVPSKNDWDKMATSVGGTVDEFFPDDYNNVGQTLKKDSFGGSNLSDFSAIKTGRRTQTGVFANIDTSTDFWEAEESTSERGFIRTILENVDYMSRTSTFDSEKVAGYSIRCLKD